jgi:hypothetical protein
MPMVTTQMTEAVDGELENFAEQHGAAGAQQRFFKGGPSDLLGRAHWFAITDLSLLVPRCAGFANTKMLWNGVKFRESTYGLPAACRRLP